MKKLIIIFAIIALFAIAFNAFGDALSGPSSDSDVTSEKESISFDSDSASTDISTEHKHEYTAKVTKEASCTSVGITTYTFSCGDSYTEEIEALGHTRVSAGGKDATCTNQGYVNIVCSVCDQGLDVEWIPAIGHNFTDAGSGCGPNCYYSCIICGEKSDILVRRDKNRAYYCEQSDCNKCEYKNFFHILTSYCVRS